MNVSEFVCITSAGPGKFTVPASILTQLPASVSTSTGVFTSSLIVYSATQPSGGMFTAPLTAGGTVSGVFLGLVGNGATVNYQ